MIDRDVHPSAEVHAPGALCCGHLPGFDQRLCWEPWQFAHHGQPHIHQHYILIRGAVGIQGFMTAVEALDYPLDQVWGADIDPVISKICSP